MEKTNFNNGGNLLLHRQIILKMYPQKLHCTGKLNACIANCKHVNRNALLPTQLSTDKHLHLVLTEFQLVCIPPPPYLIAARLHLVDCLRADFRSISKQEYNSESSAKGDNQLSAS